jgi:pyruvate ferredoxin oxidoreductase delta subunit
VKGKAKRDRLATSKPRRGAPGKAGVPAGGPVEAGKVAEEGKRERLAISKPKKGASGKTGAWRTFRPVIEPDKCSKCGLCSLYCPEGAISEDLEIDYDFCKGCGICAEECPKKAIRMEREER